MAENCTKYKTYKWQRRVVGTSEWEDVIPYVYSIDGEGTMPLITIETGSTDCCGDAPTGDTPSIGDIKWEVVTDNYMCDGTTKYQMLQMYQYNGSQWVALQQFKKGAVIEQYSTDCGYIPLSKWEVVSGEYMCSGTTKCQKTREYLSYDGGTTWTATNNYGYEAIEYLSTDCGFDPYSAYLTFVPIENTTFTYYSGGVNANIVEYSLDGGVTWSSLYSNQSTPTVNAGQEVLWRATGTNVKGRFATRGAFVVGGNIMSLIGGDEFASATRMGVSQFEHLFSGCTGLTSAQNLVLPATVAQSCYYEMFEDCTSLTTAPALPATVMEASCYNGMFKGCSSLTAAPELPATTMVHGCYDGMFVGCTSLTTAPALPATTLAGYCYTFMFMNCSGLTTAPELPATTLAASCYEYMFAGCTSLTAAPELPATALTDFCYATMFQGCTSLTTAPALPATALTDFCYEGMFDGCTSLTTAPALPATTLAGYCYQFMFRRCTSLTTAPTLAATTLTDYCYNYMFSGCTSLTAAPALPATTLANHCYRQMFRGCTSLTSITCLATDISAYECTLDWVDGVAANGTFTKAASMSDWTTGKDGIPDGWTVVNA